jgi:hypothetical protein
MLDGEGRGLGSTGEIAPLKELSERVSYRLFGQVEVSANLAVPVSLGHELENLDLTF